MADDALMRQFADMIRPAAEISRERALAHSIDALSQAVRDNLAQHSRLTDLYSELNAALVDRLDRLEREIQGLRAQLAQNN